MYEVVVVVGFEFVVIIVGDFGWVGVIVLLGLVRLGYWYFVDDLGDGIVVGVDFVVEWVIVIIYKVWVLVFVVLGCYYGFVGCGVGCCVIDWCGVVY